MPRKAKRPCSYHGCPNLSENSYCEIHRKKVSKENNRNYDQNKRDKEMYEFYNSTEWRQLRKIKIKQNPFCEECYKRGVLINAIIIDHKLPAKENPDKRLDLTNLQSLCRACHNKKTQADTKAK